jgi:hypothetical protein
MMNCANSSNPDTSDLQSIIQSEKFEIDFIDFHGSYVGSSTRSEWERKLIIDQTGEKTVASYIDEWSDTVVRKVLTISEVVAIKYWMFTALKSNATHKRYDTTCFGPGDTDFEFKSGKTKVYIKASNASEKSQFTLLKKLGLATGDDDLHLGQY